VSESIARAATCTIAAAAMAVGSMFAMAARAEGSGPATSFNPTSLGEIVVTAQKREENIERTPAAVTAFPAAKIDLAGLAGPQQLQFAVPSMTYGTVTGFTFITLRGIGTDIATSPGGQTAVATYLDGVYSGGQIAAGVQDFDLERIEVLRGPQGTLYGRNAEGGVINYISKPPSFEPGGYASASYGDYDATADDVGITGPIVPDVVSGRLSLHFGEHDGYRYNKLLHSRQDADETYSGRAAILYQPTSRLSVTLRGDVSHDRSSTPYELVSQASVSGGVSQQLPLGVFSLPAADLAGLLSPADVASLDGGSIASRFGLIQPGPLAPDPNRSLDFVSSQPTLFLTDSDGGSVTVDWNAGPMTVKSISAYRYASLKYNIDEIGEAAPQVSSAGLSYSSQVTQEIDLSGQALDDRFQWLAGAYYLRENAALEDTSWLAADGEYISALSSFTSGPGFPNYNPASPFPLTLAGGYDASYLTEIKNIYSTVVAPTAPYGGVGPQLRPYQSIPGTAFAGFAGQQASQSIAGFGQGTFKITPALRLTGGIRFTQDQASIVRSIHSNLVNTLFGLAPTGSPFVPLPPSVLAGFPAGSSLAADLGDLCNRIHNSRTWTAPTGVVGLDYDAAPHLLTYAKVSWGYKSGGFNVGQCSGSFNPEFLTDYEGGAKAVWLDGQALTNLAIYYYDYRNIQFSTFVENAAAILNAGGATALGVEMEYAFEPRSLKGFQVDGATSFENSRYGAGCFQDPASLLQPAPSAGQTVCANPAEQIEGKELIRAPRWKANFGAQYRFSLGAAGSLLLRGDAAWTDKIYNDIFNGTAPDISGLTQDPYWVINARLAWVSISGRYEAEIFGDNITNSLYATSRIAFNTPSTLENVAGQFAPPATYGVRFTIKWGSAAK
jgi:iron complex outermembrane receptor protein